MIVVRPAPWSPPADGHHWEAVEQHDEWITPPVSAGLCRFTTGIGHQQCRKEAVATLMRVFLAPVPVFGVRK